MKVKVTRRGHFATIQAAKGGCVKVFREPLPPKRSTTMPVDCRLIEVRPVLLTPTDNHPLATDVARYAHDGKFERILWGEVI